MVGLENVMEERQRPSELVSKALVKPEKLSTEEVEQLHAARRERYIIKPP